jgi:peptidoglycan/LPS O-acetylase OafA/YrhL
VNKKDLVVSEKKRLPGLDIFRIVSALFVCAFHTNIHLGCNYGLLNGVVAMGAMFMTAFFMLSGFLMQYNYSTWDFGDWKNIKRFYIKRVKEIVPMYFVAASIYVLTDSSTSILDDLILSPIEATATQTVFSSLFSLTHNGGTWFISCIMLSYLAFPLMCIINNKANKKEKTTIASISVILLLYAPIIQWRFQTNSIYENPFFRMLEFGLGSIIASSLGDIRESKIYCKLRLNRGGMHLLNA